MTKKRNRGFTLIELLVVVLIIGILAAIAVPQYQKAVLKTRVSEAQQIIANLEKAASIWVEKNGLPNEQVDILDQLDVDYSGQFPSGEHGHCNAKDICAFADASSSSMSVAIQVRTRSGFQGPHDYELVSNWTPSRGWQRNYTSCYVDIDNIGLETFGYERWEC